MTQNAADVASGPWLFIIVLAVSLLVLAGTIAAAILYRRRRAWQPEAVNTRLRRQSVNDVVTQLVKQASVQQTTPHVIAP